MFINNYCYLLVYDLGPKVLVQLPLTNSQLNKIRKPKISECFLEDSDEYDMNERASINLEN